MGSIEIPPMFTTHMLGAYEDKEKGLLYVDLLKYKDASAYTFYTFIENAIGLAINK